MMLRLCAGIRKGLQDCCSERCAGGQPMSIYPNVAVTALRDSLLPVARGALVLALLSGCSSNSGKMDSEYNVDAAEAASDAALDNAVNAIDAAAIDMNISTDELTNQPAVAAEPACAS